MCACVHRHCHTHEERESESDGERERRREGQGSVRWRREQGRNFFLRGHGVRGERERDAMAKPKKKEIFFVDGVIRAVAVSGKGSRPSADHYG